MDGLIIGVILIVIAWRGFHLAKMFFEENKRQHEIAETRANTPPEKPETVPQQPIMELILKATDGLSRIDKDGNAAVATRIGALYTLQHIAQNNIDYHIKIMEILCAYIRNNCPKTEETNKDDDGDPLRDDIQEALNIIIWRGTWSKDKIKNTAEYESGLPDILGKRKAWSEDNEHLIRELTEGYKINLSDCNLRDAYMFNANLESADLSRANLRGVNFVNARLSFANLKLANLKYANLDGASLWGANFDWTSLSNAYCYGTSMAGVRLGEMDLTEAWLLGANLSDIDVDTIMTTGPAMNMKDARTEGSYSYSGRFPECENLTQEQLNQMFFGTRAEITGSGLKRPKHWPTEDLSEDDFMKEYKKWLEKEHLSIFFTVKEIAETKLRIKTYPQASRFKPYSHEQDY